MGVAVKHPAFASHKHESRGRLTEAAEKREPKKKKKKNESNVESRLGKAKLSVLTSSQSSLQLGVINHEFLLVQDARHVQLCAVRDELMWA